ncbi:MAG: chemotaxis protein CheW [Pseudomonadota bacterium]
MPPGGEAQPSSAERSKSLIFGSFWIDRSEFALPVGAIREVVNEPDVISPVPLAPAFMKGLFNLRGMIIPIVDLRILLEFPECDGSEDIGDGRKIAIIENADKCIGILFDRTGEVLNESGSTLVGFAGNENGIKDVVIDGVLKLEDGNRIVQVIDPYEMLRIERIPKAEAAEFKADQRSKLGRRLSCVSFQLGHTNCAIDLRYVQEVRTMPPVDKSLLAHGCVIGTANLRGVIIPIIDFRSFMGDEPAYQLSDEALSKRKLLVMKSGDGMIGLMVFSIDSIVPFFENDVMPFAKLALPRGNIVNGCLVSEDEKLIMLLDHQLLMAEPTLAEIARTCHEVYNTAKEEEDPADTPKKIERKNFILFSMSSQFAMDTMYVSEVIEKPDDLLSPPYVLSFVEGIINLRGELITLINLRRLYGLEYSEYEEQKVVIFKHGAQKYAILVDSVDEIVMTTSDKVSKDEKTGCGNTVRAASQDVCGVLRLRPEDKGNMLVMIMDVDALVARCTGALSAGQ